MIRLLGGTADNGTDYRSLSGSLTIPAGASTADVAVTPIDDATVEGNETLILTLAAHAGYTVGSPNNATVTIADNDQAPPPIPTVTITATDLLASESGAETATATVTRTGSQAAELTVGYALGGTASNGVDYQTLSGSVTIPASAASENIVVRPIDDSLFEVAELVTITLSPDSAYAVGPFAIAIITVLDNDLLILGNGPLTEVH